MLNYFQLLLVQRIKSQSRQIRGPCPVFSLALGGQPAVGGKPQKLAPCRHTFGGPFSGQLLQEHSFTRPSLLQEKPRF